MMSNNKKQLHWKHFRGFTLIELILVFALMGLLTVTGVNAFFSYSRNQDYKTAISDVAHTLNLARSRAISQVKPSQCGAARLDGYEFWYSSAGKTYRTRVRCSGIYYDMDTRSLPQNVSFTSNTTVFFNVSTGTTNAVRNIIITGYGKTTTVRVDTTGVVSVL